MRGLFIPASSAPTSNFIGIIFQMNEGGGTHVGVAWRDRDREMHVLHQRWHLHLQLEDAPNARDAVVQLNLPRARVLPTIQWARRVYGQVQNALPYAFKLPPAVFEEKTGKLILRRGEGLTCSTFVIALLESAGIKLLQLDEWPSRPDDNARNRDLVEHMRQYYLKREQVLTQSAIEHLVYLDSQISAIRYRPEEVAGAASVVPLPASFLQAVAAAEELLVAYGAHFPVPLQALVEAPIVVPEESTA